MVFKRLNIDSIRKGSPLRETNAQKEGLGMLADTLDARTKAEAIAESVAEKQRRSTETPKEFGGPKGLEPTRYGDWEKAGRCFDF